MVNVARILATLSLVVGASHAYAATYLFRATGTAEPFYSVDGNFNSVANPSSRVHAGDAVKISFLLDTAGLQPESVFAADPNIHIYYAQLQSFRLDIGTYHSHAAGNAAGFASVELWDNHQIAGLGPVDQFSISAVRGITSSKSPVDLGTGAIYESFGINAFDFSRQRPDVQLDRCRTAANVLRLAERLFRLRQFEHLPRNRVVDERSGSLAARRVRHARARQLGIDDRRLRASAAWGCGGAMTAVRRLERARPNSDPARVRDAP